MDGQFFTRRKAALSLTALILAAAPALADDAAPWTLEGELSGGVATAIALDPSNTNNIYALVPDQGIYLSHDGGGSWSLAYPSTSVLDLVIDPLTPSTLYATTGNNMVWKSTDSGATWQGSGTGLPITMDTGSTVKVTVDPVDEGTAYLITWGSGVYKTVDSGAHWSAINTGIDSSSSTNLIQSGAGINSLTVDPMNPQVLYLAAWSSMDVVTGLPGLGIAGVYRSTDGGGQWVQVLSGEDTFNLAVQPGNDQTVFASGNYNFYTSTDGGAHWAGYNGPNAPCFANVIRFAPSNPQQMWVGTDQLYASNDGGVTWTEPTTDYVNYPVSDMAVDPASGTLYAASAGFGVSKSSDGGVTWLPIDTGIHDVTVSQILVGDDGALYIGTTTSGLFRSTDSGASWTGIDDGIFSGVQTPVRQIVDDPAASSLYLISSGFFKSTDHGASWTRIIIPSSDSFGAVAVTPGQPSTVYASDGGVVRSSDSGDTWVRVGAGLPHDVVALASGPTDAQTVFAGTASHGLYRSTDGAAHWSQVTSLVAADVESILIDPADPTTIYAAADDEGILKSTDDGSSWVSASNGLDPDDLIDSIEIDPADSAVLIAMAEDSKHVYLSADGGADWIQVSGLLLSDTAVTQSTGSSSKTLPAFVTLSMDPLHKGMMYGADGAGHVYKVSVSALAQAAASSGKLSSAGSGASSGGGDFSLLMSTLLLGFALRRRGHAQPGE